MTATAAPTSPARPAWLRYPLGRQLWRDLGYLALTLPLSIVSFTVVVTGFSLSVSLAVFLVGVPVAIAWFVVDRALCDLQRRRAATVLGRAIPRGYRSATEPGLVGSVKTWFRDVQTCRDLAWLCFDGAVGFGLALVPFLAIGQTLGSLTLPVWFWALPETAEVQYGLFTVDTTGETWRAVAAGVVLVPVTIALVRGAALAHAHVSRLLLRPSRGARVEELTESRAGAVDAAHEELQRIERDLHDGAQARLVALAMDLGLAERKIGGDPEARELIGEARGEALRALGELRELVRGIGPSILRDRGLEAAIASLAAGRAQPVDARVHVDDRRPPATVEAAAYFVVAECLANAAKHSGASRVTVRVWRDAAERLVVECSDDGHGGADPAAGSGLSGLRKRVAALDGTLAVTSPPGGPTTVRAEIPCGS